MFIRLDSNMHSSYTATKYAPVQLHTKCKERLHYSLVNRWSTAFRHKYLVEISCRVEIRFPVSQARLKYDTSHCSALLVSPPSSPFYHRQLRHTFSFLSPLLSAKQMKTPVMMVKVTDSKYSLQWKRSCKYVTVSISVQNVSWVRDDSLSETFLECTLPPKS